MRHGKTSALYRRHIVVHEIYLVVLAMAAGDIQCDFESFQRFEDDIGLHIVGSVVDSRADERRVLRHQPVVVDSIVDIVGSYGSKCKSQPRSH